MTAEPLLPDVSAWAHADLHRRVIEAVAALPVYFRTETFISGIPAPDLHTLHGVLGASIEDQLVATLNTMRAIKSDHPVARGGDSHHPRSNHATTRP